MANRIPLSVGEWYHCYSRGVDKRQIFKNEKDYDRFLALMLVANGTKPVHLSNLKSTDLSAIANDQTLDRGKPLLEVGAYCLMPNHVHIIVQETKEGSVATYMQKLFTGYTMYFNKRNDRTGALFSGTFKSKHLDDDSYLKQALAYVHLNPVELINSRWKDGSGNLTRMEKTLRAYPYSSLNDFVSAPDKRGKILGATIFEMFDSIPSTKALLEDAQEYYVETNIKV